MLSGIVRTILVLLTICGVCMMAFAGEQKASAVQGREESTENKSQQQKREVYSFGVVPQYAQRRLFRIWQPILAELEKRTGLKFKLVGTAKIPIFEKKFLEGRFDFAYMNPYHMLKANEQQGYLPLIRAGSQPLKGILVVRKDNSIKSIFELEGKEVAFPAPNALGASLLMRAELSKRHNIKIFPRYVQSHSSVYLHVAKGLTIAGGGVERTLQGQSQAIRDTLRILYTTQAVPPHPIAAHPRVSVAHRQMVQAAILEMSAEPRWQTQLSLIPLEQATVATLDEYNVMKNWGLDEFFVEE